MTVYTKTNGTQVPITEMVTPYLKNAIAKLEREIADGLKPVQAHLLEPLKNELSGRTDA